MLSVAELLSQFHNITFAHHKLVCDVSVHMHMCTYLRIRNRKGLSKLANNLNAAQRLYQHRMSAHASCF